FWATIFTSSIFVIFRYTFVCLAMLVKNPANLHKDLNLAKLTSEKTLVNMTNKSSYGSKTAA
ncbi:MAG: hypothetical protein PUE11_04830, partial [Paraprevotella sp.]|nr:hypothetical protein [Paraprevotella sp.]